MNTQKVTATAKPRTTTLIQKLKISVAIVNKIRRAALDKVITRAEAIEIVNEVYDAIEETKAQANKK